MKTEKLKFFGFTVTLVVTSLLMIASLGTYLATVSETGKHIPSIEHPMSLFLLLGLASLALSISAYKACWALAFIAGRKDGISEYSKTYCRHMPEYNTDSLSGDIQRVITGLES